ncbi:MAG: PGF-pre-PGF domain-containing protein [archaeon]|nr:PGF-pre-PGF domain-containing protein [archaeon]
MRKNLLTIIFVAIIALFAIIVYALGTDTSVSNVNVTAPIANQNISGNLFINVTAAHIAGGDGNITNVTVNFLNISDATNPTVLNSTVLVDDDLAVNLTFNKTINTVALGLIDGVYNLTINATNASDGAILNNFTVFKTPSDLIVIDNTAPTVVSIVSPTASSTTTSGSILINVSLNNDSRVTAIETVIFQVSNSSGTAFNVTSSATNGTLWNASIAISTLTDGTQIITIYANDTAGNMNDSETVTITTDDSAPTISASSGSASSSSTGSISVTTNEAATCKYSASSTDAYGAMADIDGAGTASHSKSFGSLSASTAYTYYVLCQDTAGNAMTTSTSVSFTTSSSNGGGSGGSGGGQSSGTQGQSSQKTWSSIAQGETATVDVTNGAIGVTQVSFAVADKTFGAWVKVLKVEEFPSTVSTFSGEVYRKLQITENNVKKVLDGSVTVAFKVENSWLKENGLTKSGVALFRNVDGVWTQLETTAGEDDGTYTHFTAQTPGFSYFVIGQKESAVVAPTTTATEGQQAAPSEQPAADSGDAMVAEDLQNSPTTAIVVVLVLLALGGVLWWSWSRR